MDIDKSKKPNRLLRHERELRGWSQAKVADELSTSVDTVGKWERGINNPDPFYREQLCTLFEKNAIELGFVVDDLETLEAPNPHIETSNQVQLSSESTLSGNTIVVLKEEQAALILKVLGENSMAFDSARRKLLQALLTGGVASMASNSDLLDPEPWTRLNQAVTDTASLDEKTLTKFEKITKHCWMLLKYDGLPTVEQLLPTYLPKVAQVALSPSKYQEQAANIASQGYILAGLIAVLNSQHIESERLCESAVFYARIAKDRNLEAAALKHLATKFLDNGNPVKTLETYLEVIPFIEDLSPLLQGRTHLGLALAYARTNQEKEAFYYLELAKDTFPDDPESDPSFAYADCGLPSLNHYGGLIYSEFKQYEQARDTFNQVDSIAEKIVVPERTKIEIVNCNADASLQLKDLATATSLIARSINGSANLESEKRREDALDLYKRAKQIWPREQQVKNLADLYLSVS